VVGLTFGKGDPAADSELLDYVYNVDLLIIDDLGTEFITSLSTAALFDLINSRLLNQKSTVISTNLNLPDIDRIYSERVLSRINGGYTHIMLIGEDLRVG